jgi:hypothetical protein
LNLNAEQKYRDHGTKHDYRRGTRLARRNKSNPNVQQNIGTVEQNIGTIASMKELIEYKSGTKI